MASAQSFGIAYPSERFLSPEHALAVAGLSDEHGKLARTDFDLEIGAQVRIVPNHSCPVANLAREYMAMALHLGRSTQLQTRAEVASAKAIDMRTSYI